ncbi:MAG TPA: hypothetical protein VKV19_14315 [Ktedonobacteraceae bacterium]|nr:hypothetical protein [Ktedonobacteraceae bacterium]
MGNYNTTHQHTMPENTGLLADAALYRFEQHVQEAPLAHCWICTGCGMVHAGSLPEECRNCGATGLEFQYSSPVQIGPRS